MKKWIFVVGAGIGYVLGTKAGRRRYEQMKTKARETLDRPEVKDATQAAKAKLDELVAGGRRKMRDVGERTEASGTDGFQATPYSDTNSVSPSASSIERPNGDI